MTIKVKPLRDRIAEICSEGEDFVGVGASAYDKADRILSAIEEGGDAIDQGSSNARPDTSPGVTAGAVEVCEICDIAGCRHIRERKAVDPTTIRAEDVIARNGAGATAIAMLTHIAETLRAKGKAVLTTGDDFGAQVLEFAALIDKEEDHG